MDDDRRVHAAWAQMEVVRYNRAGKWYLEPRGNGKRQHVTIKEAADYALWAYHESAGWFHLDLAGGSSFDRLIDEGINGG